MVTSFNYLGLVMMVGGDNWPEVVGNLRKDQKSEAWLTRILGREGAKPRLSGMFFNAVVQAVLLFGLETWVLTPHMIWDLGGFQNRFAWRITGRQPRRRGDGGWEYQPLTSAMEEVGFKEIRFYIQKNQNRFARYIATRPILELCERSVQIPGA